MLVLTLDEIKKAIQCLPLRDVEALRNSLDEYLESDGAIADDVASALEQSKREIAEGKFIERRSDAQ